MKISGNSILITGGASGIGLALTRRLAAEGNRLLICGRDATKLARAHEALPEVDVFPCDINSESDRQKMLSHIRARHSDLNILINNAAVTGFVDFTQNAAALADQIQTELGIDLLAPIQLTALLLPHLSRQPASVVVNVTSALAYVPMAIAPLYCAAKAGLHSFSQSLRHQLRNSSTRIIEVLIDNTRIVANLLRLKDRLAVSAFATARRPAATNRPELRCRRRPPTERPK
jgi:uncharacterized oxidoreductase